ncbi:hypothetical protein KP509_32G001100 [Ceratopteris richardii]|uniref:Uncharacterized protein n=1 Tax=Ceratopteris richardii TaxID=49495 RepID=A0A8T2QQ73_CERRI|nr:hypothetical protein KP509_32G001100 [Ceratopteris richardii]
MLIQAADDAQQLAERLEKSEAGRKKLRQAISILQEKLEGLEKVLKANEKLRQECEQERQRAESEKEKAAEERRLRSQLEKDSSTFKDQMAKVLQRLGAVENKQRSDRKEIERLRTEVKISVEGMHAASQAVNAVQSSIQIVESNLLGKVNAAFEEANNASKAVNVVQSNLQTLQSNLQDKVIEAFEEVRGSSQAVKDVQNSLHSLELRIAKQVAASSEPRFQLAGHVTEKLVDEISHLFNKERQSHCKIKRRLVKLKSAFQETNKSYALSYTDKNAELEGFMSPNRRDEGSQRKRLRAEEDVFERRVRKDRAFDMVIGSNAVDRLGLDQSEMDQSMISPFSMEHQRILDEKPVSFCIPSHNTTSDDNIDTALFDHRSTSKLETRVQMVKAMEDNTEENLTKSMFKVGDRICYNHMVMKNGADSEGQCKDGTGVSQGRKKNLVVDKKDNAEETSPLYRSIAKACGSVTHVDDISHNNGLDHDDNSSDDSEWKWPDDMVLLSPSLPEIPSPSHHIHASSAEPSSKALDPNTDCYLQCNILESNACAVWNAVKSYGDDKTGAGFAKSSDAQFDVNIIRSNDVQCDANYHSKCEVESFAGQKRNQNSDSVVQPGMEMTDNTSNESSDDTAVQNPHTSEGTGFNSRVSVINTDDLISHEIGSAFQEPHAQSDLVSSIEEVSNAIAENHPVVDPFGVSMSGHSVGTGFNNQTERQLETFPLDAVGDVAISEINSFLDVLPPMLGSFQGEIRATDRSVSDPTVPNGGICKFGKASLCDQSMPALEGQLSTSHSSEKIVLELSSPVYGHYNIQETLPLTSEPFNKIKGHEPGDVFLLRCFELQEADAAVNLIATSIIVNDFGRHLADDDIEKGTILLQESMLFRVINDLPLPYVACSIISHAVCLARPEKGITEANSTVHIVDSLLQAYVAFISSSMRA